MRISSIRIRRTKDYKLAGMVGGGGTWFVQSIYDHSCDLWYAHWEVGNQNDADQKIWSVRYECVLQKQEPRVQQFSLESLKQELVVTLTEVLAFAKQYTPEPWGEWFLRALVCLSSERPEDGFYHHNLIVLKNHSLLAKQIFFAAANAWVFGGMGSWNDMGFSDEATNGRYERLSEQLYDVVIRGLVGSINS